MEGGGWRVEGGGWRVEGGGQRVDAHVLLPPARRAKVASAAATAAEWARRWKGQSVRLRNMLLLKRWRGGGAEAHALARRSNGASSRSGRGCRGGEAECGAGAMGCSVETENGSGLLEGLGVGEGVEIPAGGRCFSSGGDLVGG